MKKKKKNKQIKKILMAISAASVLLQTLHELINSDEIKYLRNKLRKGKISPGNGFGKNIKESIGEFESA